MDSIYSMAVVVILAAAAGAFIGFVVIDHSKYRKQRILDTLTQQGATEINIRVNLYKQLFGSRLMTGRFRDDVYHVQYKDANAVMHKTSCTFSQVTDEIEWLGEF